MRDVNRTNIRRNSRKNPRRRGSGFFYFRIVLCILIIAAAAVLKWTNSPIVATVSQTINSGLGLSEAVEAVSRAASGDGAILEVFRQSEKEPETETENEKKSEEPVFNQDFYIAEDAKNIENEMKENDARLRNEEAREKIEQLSFHMTAEELSDDTEAVPFRIPPPSYASYNKTAIAFKYTCPLYGVITSKFGYRDHPIIEDASFHTGLDIAAGVGTAVKAFAAGTVLETGTNNTYGRYILLGHSGGIRSFYGHNSKLCVKKGQKVKLGQKICEVGSTGLSTGPHLHFEIREGTRRLDPSHYISPGRV